MILFMNSEPWHPLLPKKRTIESFCDEEMPVFKISRMPCSWRNRRTKLKGLSELCCLHCQQS